MRVEANELVYQLHIPALFVHTHMLYVQRAEN